MTTHQHSSKASSSGSFDEAARHRFLKVVGMLGSSHPGERAAAALQASRMLREHGLNWSDLLGRHDAAASPYGPSDLHDSAPQWRQLAARCRQDARKLLAWEIGFLDSLVAHRQLPDGYADVLCGIADKVLRDRDIASGGGNDAPRRSGSSHRK